MKFKSIILFILTLSAFSHPAGIAAQRLNDQLLNRPYADNRRWHLGFGVGIHVQDYAITNSGITTADSEQWFCEVPNFQPGFNVSGLFDLRLSNYFNVRLSPGLYFGNRIVKFRDYTSGAETQQDIKSAHLALPVDLKFSGMRYRNARPYIVAGFMPSVDVAKKRSDLLKVKPTDFYLSFGFGCDFYLPYFKLIPELKFCFGMRDMLDRNRPDLDDSPEQMKFTNAIKKMTSSMVILTFYFE